MSYIVNNYTPVHSYHLGKKGYVNKFEKSFKSPFLNVLHNQLQHARPVLNDDTKIDDSEIAVSDNIELSSAVVSATAVGDSSTGIA